MVVPYESDPSVAGQASSAPASAPEKPVEELISFNELELSGPFELTEISPTVYEPYVRYGRKRTLRRYHRLPMSVIYR